MEAICHIFHLKDSVISWKLDTSKKLQVSHEDALAMHSALPSHQKSERIAYQLQEDFIKYLGVSN